MQFEKPSMESVYFDSKGVKSACTKVVNSIVTGVRFQKNHVPRNRA
jgi:hypothetical protein